MSEKPTARFWWTLREAPVGPLLLAATEDGLVKVAFHTDDVAAGSTVDRLTDQLGAEPTQMSAATACGTSQRRTTASEAGQIADDRPPAGETVLREASAELDAYVAGDLREFATPLDWSLASAFHTRVLRALAHTVPYGQVTGYRDLAVAVGEPGAARAVGAAMGANPLPIIVPCHRVVESGGGIGGFGGGLETKRGLLALEGVLPQPLFD